DRSSDHFRDTIGAEIRAWQDDILELVRQRGAGKRTTARVLAFGINSVGIALMLVLFSQTAGLSGGELAIGAGTAGLSQTLLSALFGEQAVRELAAEARGLLLARAEGLLDHDRSRYQGLVDDLIAPEAAADAPIEATADADAAIEAAAGDDPAQATVQDSVPTGGRELVTELERAAAAVARAR
ncbi:MAG: ABC transporter, partial [Actinomycetota bacterium]